MNQPIRYTQLCDRLQKIKLPKTCPHCEMGQWKYDHDDYWFILDKITCPYYFFNGICKFGDQCKSSYSHILKSDVTTYSLKLQRIIQHTNSRKKLCLEGRNSMTKIFTADWGWSICSGMQVEADLSKNSAKKVWSLQRSKQR